MLSSAILRDLQQTQQSARAQKKDAKRARAPTDRILVRRSEGAERLESISLFPSPMKDYERGLGRTREDCLLNWVRHETCQHTDRKT